MTAEREAVVPALCKHDKRDPDDRGPYECPAWKAYEDDAGIAKAALDAHRAAPGDVEAMAPECISEAEDKLAAVLHHIYDNSNYDNPHDQFCDVARHVLRRIAAAVAAERERAATVCEGRPCQVAGDDFRTSGNGEFWDADSAYARGRIDAAAAIRAGAPGDE